jgi:molybdate transport system permease protein
VTERVSSRLSIATDGVRPVRPPRNEPAKSIRSLDAWWLLSLPLLAFLLIPLVALFVRVEPGRLLQNLGSEQAVQAIQLSLRTTLISTLLTIVFGTPIAQLLSRKHLRFRRPLDTLVDLPTVMPPSVAGIALLVAFGRRGLLGGALDSFGVHIAFTEAAVILAQTFVAAPFYIKAAAIGFAGIDAEIKEAAAIDGASGRQMFRFVIMPLSWSALVSGATMTWARALGEFGATIIFAGNFPGRTQTMPLAIYLGFELELGVALSLSVILIGLSFLSLLVVKVVLNRATNTWN